MRPQEFKQTRQGIPVCVQSAKAIIFAISYHRCAHYRRGSEIDPASPHCYDFSAGWSSLVARWAHNPKVGGSNPPPATNSINHLAGFTDFHLGQIRVTNTVYCTEVVIVGQSILTSFSGFQPSCSALCFTKSTKRRCSSRLASICGAPYTWEVVAIFSCRSRVFTSSSVNPASFPQALTACRKLCQPIFGSPALTATSCT